MLYVTNIINNRYMIDIPSRMISHYRTVAASYWKIGVV